ncbi:MAG TPA: AGE family epimerase/isomerase [Marmoricola sp.]|nr:AGE family epimerase/isomerase [Marmoricola sp.]
MSPARWPDAAWLVAEGDRLLGFARASPHPAGGFGWLDDRGRLDPGQPRPLYVTCRMTHVFALAHRLGKPWAGPLVDHGLAALSGPFRDEEYGGWFAALAADGAPVTEKSAYEHAFVVLAASSAAAADRPGATDLLEEALAVLDRHFWDEQHGMLLDRWDRAFAVPDAYRGANANMHGVEALLAAAEVTGSVVLRRRALRITARLVHEVASRFGWRVPEHFDAGWHPLPDYNREEPAHPFRPFGATVGHWFEWARLAASLHVALRDPPGWLLDDARALFAAAAATWSCDGTDGFVYTVDWDGRPVVRQRMHWVVAEAIGAAAVLGEVTGGSSYDAWTERLWRYADAFLLDREQGSWHHELGPDNRPANTVWHGKPDVYHAFQATLLSRLPLALTGSSDLAPGG